MGKKRQKNDNETEGCCEVNVRFPVDHSNGRL